MHAVVPDFNTRARAVIPYYAAASVAFLISAFFLILSHGSFFGHYFQPKLLAITHLLALGWGTMVIFGALHQFIPVLLEVRLFSERIALATFFLLVTGVAGLIYSFWSFEVGWTLQTSSVLIFIAISFFAYNIYRTTRTAKKWSVSADFIVASVFWLLLTVSAGVLLAFNFRYLFLPESHLHYLKVHAHLGIAGWFLILIIGVSSRLIPMFLLSPQPSENNLTYTYYLVNLGLLAFISNALIFKNEILIYLSLVSCIAGILVYVLGLRSCYRKRVRKSLDTGMRQSLMAFALPAVSLLLLVAIVSFNSEAAVYLPLYTAYGFSIFFGFISTLILGQVYKTLPFIVWLRIKQKNTQTKILPRDLYSEKHAKYQLVLHLSGVFVSLFSLLLKIKILFVSGAVLITLSALIFNINLFRMLYYLIIKQDEPDIRGE